MCALHFRVNEEYARNFQLFLFFWLGIFAFKLLDILLMYLFAIKFSNGMPYVSCLIAMKCTAIESELHSRNFDFATLQIHRIREIFAEQMKKEHTVCWHC